MATPTNVLYTSTDGDDVILAGTSPPQVLRFQNYPNSTPIQMNNDYSLFTVNSWTAGQNENPPISPTHGPNNIIVAWGVGIYDYVNDKLYNYGGGHGDGAGNDVIEFDAANGTYRLVREASNIWDNYQSTPPFMGNYPAPYPPPGPDWAYTFSTPRPYMPDGSKPSVHSYGAGEIKTNNGDLYLWGGSLAGGTGVPDFSLWKFNIATATWTPINIQSSGVGLGATLKYDHIRDRLYLIRSGTIFLLDQDDGSLTTLTTNPTQWVSDGLGVSFDFNRQIFVIMGQISGNTGNPAMWIGDAVTGVITRMPQSLVDTGGPGADYNPHIDRHVFWGGGNSIVHVHPTTYALEEVTVEGSAPLISLNGMFGRFRWSRNLERYIIQVSFRDPVAYIEMDINSRILPSIANYDFVPADQPVLRIDGGGGERPEIGLFTEWQAAYIGRGMTDDDLRAHIILQADNLLTLPWDDLDAMRNTHNLSFDHTPSAFFLPYLLTKDTKYITPMRNLWAIYQEHRQVAIDGAMNPLNGRQLAWQLRNLFQLAYLERINVITDSNGIYGRALEATRLSIINNMSDPRYSGFNIVGLNMTPSSADWTGWMEGYNGHVFAHGIMLGFDNWTSIAEWHLVHFDRRSGGAGGWPMAFFDNDHVDVDNSVGTATWTSYTDTPRTAGPHSGVTDLQAAASRHAHLYFTNIPSADLAPLVSDSTIPPLPAMCDVNGNVVGNGGFVPTLSQRMAFSERILISLSAVAMYSQAGITGASTIYNRVNSARERRGDTAEIFRYGATIDG